MGREKSRIVVLGGSFAGLSAAYGVRKKLGDRVEITLVSADSEFTFIPSLPWLMMGWRRPEAITVPLARPLSRKGINFLHDKAIQIDPVAQVVVCASGQTLGYDYLLAATGADLDWSNVPGSDPAAGQVQTCFTREQAVSARGAIARFLDSGGGRAIVGANPGASCIGPAYEVIMMLETELRRRRRRHLFDLHLVTPEPYLGHFGVSGIGNLTRLMEDEFRSRHLVWTTNAALASVEPGQAALADGAELPFDLAILIPAFLGARAVREANLGNSRGFVETDKYLRSPRFPNIYAAGVAVAIPPTGATAVPVGVPKTGQMSEEMGRRAAHNLAVDIRGSGDLLDCTALAATCIADAGDVAFYIKADPFLPPRNVALLRRGRRYRYLKMALERYYLQKVKRDLPSVH